VHKKTAAITSIEIDKGRDKGNIQTPLPPVLDKTCILWGNSLIAAEHIAHPSTPFKIRDINSRLNLMIPCESELI